MALRSSAEAGQPQGGRTVTLDPALPRKAAAELLGTALLVFFGCGVATVTFGFRAVGSSYAAGVVASSLAFGIVMTAMVAIIGPISGSHINPAVTLGAFLSRRITLQDAVGYWIAQFVGAILGAALLYWVMTLTRTIPRYSTSAVGLGANGWGSSPVSALHITGGGAFLTEIIITAVFVLVVLSATARTANVAISGAAIGLGLALANLVATPVDGASVNPARSFGPALILAGQPIRQVWLFILAPLVGAILAAGVYLLFHAGESGYTGSRFGLPGLRPAGSAATGDTGTRQAGVSTGTASGTGGTDTAAGGRPGAPSGTGAAGTARGNPASGPQPPDNGRAQRLPARGSAARTGVLSGRSPSARPPDPP
jgi:aquaporin Z